jgi:hypothetical protein
MKKVNIDFNLSVPILFLVFNRKNTTLKVFEAIKQAKPSKIYISCDGARSNVEGEIEIVSEIRNFILSNIDWECKIMTRFLDENSGCKLAVSSAINWFFEHEEMGIILEDDCLPSISFFSFCNTMLDRYKNDTRVMMIGGTNYLIDNREKLNSDYFFARQFSIWGWATWRRSWHNYDINISTWLNDIQPKDLSSITRKNYVRQYYVDIFNSVKNEKVNTWDIQWVYTCIFNSGICIVPSINLITNIGVDGTHAFGKTTKNHFLERKSFDSDDFYISPSNVFPNLNYEEKFYKQRVLPIFIFNKFILILKYFHLFSLLRYIKRTISR